MSAAEKTVSNTTIVTLAAESALRLAQGNRKKALDDLKRRVERDRTLRDALLAPYVDRAISNALAMVAPIKEPVRSRHNNGYKSRRKIEPSPAPARAIQGLKRLALSNATDYLREYQLQDGTRLGNAKRMHLVQEAKTMRDNIARNAKHYRFISLIAEHLTDDKTVAEHFTNERLDRWMKEAEAQRCPV